MKKLRQISAIVILGMAILSLRFLITPDYDNGFQRSSLSIEQGLDAVEVVVADLPSRIGKQHWPERGYHLRILAGNPPYEYLDRFEKYEIPEIRRGYIKHFADDLKTAQIDIDSLEETSRHSIIVSGRIRYANSKVNRFKILFKYHLSLEGSKWQIKERELSDRPEQ